MIVNHIQTIIRNKTIGENEDTDNIKGDSKGEVTNLL